GAGDFEDGDAATGVVVGAGTLVLEVATEGDLFVFELGIGRRDRGGNDFEISGMLSRFDYRAQLDLLALAEAFTQRACSFQRNHEAEGLVRRESFEVAPADQIFVFARPSGFLVLRVADD